MVDSVSRQVRSKTMRAIRSKDTKIEHIVSARLSEQRFRFRKNISDLPGKPDFALKKYKIVIFIDSCFWHGCRTHCRIPNSNTDYWFAKIKRNKKRDKEVNLFYRKENWVLLRFWEHDINGNLEKCFEAIGKSIIKQKEKLKMKV